MQDIPSVSRWVVVQCTHTHTPVRVLMRKWWKGNREQKRHCNFSPFWYDDNDRVVHTGVILEQQQQQQQWWLTDAGRQTDKQASKGWNCKSDFASKGSEHSDKPACTTAKASLLLHLGLSVSSSSKLTDCELLWEGVHRGCSRVLLNARAAMISKERNKTNWFPSKRREKSNGSNRIKTGTEALVGPL